MDSSFSGIMHSPILTWFYVIVIVRSSDRFLAVQESGHEQSWYLPAGKVKPGESFVRAAIRETKEESGISIRVNGIMRIEHLTSLDRRAKIRCLFLSSPIDNTPPKSEADIHSKRAEWLTIDELKELHLRHDEVIQILSDASQHRPIYPLSILSHMQYSHSLDCDTCL